MDSVGYEFASNLRQIHNYETALKDNRDRQ
jgi:hypothetical protein